jgi:hypothetical protein
VTIVERQFENYVENYEFPCMFEFSGEKKHYRRPSYGCDEPPTDCLRHTSFSCSIHTLTEDLEANTVDKINPVIHAYRPTRAIFRSALRRLVHRIAVPDRLVHIGHNGCENPQDSRNTM